MAIGVGGGALPAMRTSGFGALGVLTRGLAAIAVVLALAASRRWLGLLCLAGPALMTIGILELRALPRSQRTIRDYAGGAAIANALVGLGWCAFGAYALLA
jgi:hypothetical protein